MSRDSVTSELYANFAHLRVLAQVLTLHDCLQYAADKCIQVNFVAIGNSSLDGASAATELDLASFTAGLAEFENASAAYYPCGKHLELQFWPRLFVLQQ